MSSAPGSRLCESTGTAFATYRCPLIAVDVSWNKLIAERGQAGMCLCVLVLLLGNSAMLRLLCIIGMKKQRVVVF